MEEKDWLKPENRFLATPMDLLRQGVKTRNWAAVDAAYTAITGEAVGVPAPTPVTVQINSTKPTQEATEKVEQLVKEELNKTIPKRKRGRPRKNPILKYPQAEQPVSKATNVELLPQEVVIPETPKIDTPDHIPPSMADCVAPARSSTGDKIYTKSKRHDCSPHPNTWKDEGVEAADEIVKDRKVPANILNNQRPPTKPVKVRCSECGTVDSVDPGLLPHGLRLTKDYRMRYRCNSCIVGAKSGRFADGDSDELFEENDDLIGEEELVDG